MEVRFRIAELGVEVKIAFTVLVEVEQSGATHNFLDDATKMALNFVVALAALMHHLPDLGGQLFDTGFRAAKVLLERDQAFQPGGLGLHQGQVGAVLVELTLEVLELLQAIGAAENLQDVLAAL